MLKRTLFFSQPCYLCIKDRQLVYQPQENKAESRTFPVEDLGFVVIENKQISITLSVIESLTDNNTALIFCDSRHMPKSLLLNLDGNTIQTEIFSDQINAGAPLKKNLWKQTVEAKIENQKRLLKKLGREYSELKGYRDSVQSGDITNREAVAAAVYWKRIFDLTDFGRERDGPFPNNALNYGYSILRAAVARSLSGSGLLPTIGLHHHNRYNAFCLADDIMEPFRPYVDECVYHISLSETSDSGELTIEMKKKLLELLTVDTVYPETKRPLMVGLSQTTASLARCFSSEAKKIIYPLME